MNGVNTTLPVDRLLVTAAPAFWRAVEATAAKGRLSGATVAEANDKADIFDLLTR